MSTAVSGGGSGVGNSNWQYINPYGMPQVGSAAYGAGGGGIDLLAGYRSILDARRAAINPARTPQAEYPDGYLGNVRSRREDRLLKNVQSRLTQRNYQRGVHKGDRIDPQDYYWKDAVNPQIGLEYEAQGLSWTQQGDTDAGMINHLGKNHLLAPEKFDRVANQVGIMQTENANQIDPIRSAKMSRLLPRWK